MGLWPDLQGLFLCSYVFSSLLIQDLKFHSYSRKPAIKGYANLIYWGNISLVWSHKIAAQWTDPVSAHGSLGQLVGPTANTCLEIETSGRRRKHSNKEMYSYFFPFFALALVEHAFLHLALVEHGCCGRGMWWWPLPPSSIFTFFHLQNLLLHHWT